MDKKFDLQNFSNGINGVFFYAQNTDRSIIAFMVYYFI